MSEDILTSAAAFVEGGIQDACDDSCSICLEEFSDSDPSTVCILHIRRYFCVLNVLHCRINIIFQYAGDRLQA